MKNKRNVVLNAVGQLPDNASWQEILTCVYSTAAKTAPPDVYSRTIEVFNNGEKASYWLLSQNTGLGGVTPLSLIEVGKTKDVLDVLGRIEYGVYG